MNFWFVFGSDEFVLINVYSFSVIYGSSLESTQQCRSMSQLQRHPYTSTDLHMMEKWPLLTYYLEKAVCQVTCIMVMNWIVTNVTRYNLLTFRDRSWQFPAFKWTRRSIIGFTIVGHWNLSHTNPNHIFMIYFLRYILILSYHLCLGVLCGLFRLSFQNEIL